MIEIQLQTDDFEIGAEQKTVRKRSFDIGALIAFVGLVRDFEDERKLVEMQVEYYPGMTERELLKICNEAKKRWDSHFIKVIHRYGNLCLGDQIVMVMVASKHRKSAFNSADYIMDYLKSRAPFWKKESTLKTKKWVIAKKSDEDLLANWGTSK